jgi:hypothetical protein
MSNPLKEIIQDSYDQSWYSTSMDWFETGKLERGRTKGRWGHISQQLFAFILFQYISNFPFPLGAYQFPASISLGDGVASHQL